MTTRQKQSFAIEAFQLQRKALHLSRWAYLNERGAFELQDAANFLRLAAARLEAVSVAVLQECPQYAPRLRVRRAA